MPHIKCELGFYGDLYVSQKDVFYEGREGSLGGNQTEFVDGTGDSGVGGPNHRETSFDTAKDRISQMLLRPGRTQEPSVIRYVGKEVGATENKLPRQVANRILETDQRRDSCLVV